MACSIFIDKEDFDENSAPEENGCTQKWLDDNNLTLEKLKLEGSTNCFNCNDCSDCSSCTTCSQCSACSTCSTCSGCTSCSACSACTDCTSCSNCNGLGCGCGVAG